MYNNSFAYVSAPYRGDKKHNMHRAREYSRTLYEMGFIPICPYLLFPQFLRDDIPEQRKAQGDMALAMLRRCRVLVVCSDEITEEMLTEIMLAKRLGIVATTMEGIKKISLYGHEGKAEYDEKE